ncbi:MAG TPA: PIG-L family deacetylase [Clostridiales bacterium]|nr:PIG-L family deacetylase [Clostridiales bacterium]
MSFKIIDTNKGVGRQDINLLFPGWEEGKEKLAVFSPHDDDALIGASYAMKTVQENQGEVYVFIFCNGNAGYSHIDQKDTVVNVRKEETVLAYSKLGIPKENIIRFDWNDFDAIRYLGREKDEDDQGSFQKVITILRNIGITRLLVPNHHKEHMDHTAVHLIGSYHAPQAGDPIVVDWGDPLPVKSVAEYSVWADFSPLDALSEKRTLRANRILLVEATVEENVRQAITEYRSQGKIIADLIASRDNRRLETGFYMELYILFDPRPKLDYTPYKQYLNDHGLL